MLYWLRDRRYSVRIATINWYEITYVVSKIFTDRHTDRIVKRGENAAVKICGTDGDLLHKWMAVQREGGIGRIERRRGYVRGLLER